MTLVLRLRATAARHGNLALHTLSPGASPARVLAHRREVLASLGFGLDDLVVAEQVHGARVAEVGRGDRGRGSREAGSAVPGTDALVCREPGVVLAVLTADCPAICFYDPEGPAVALLHAGWRGILAGVVEAALDVLAPRNRSAVRGCVAPHARPCCYEVGEEVAARFPEEAVRREGGRRPRLDLARAVELRAGILLEPIPEGGKDTNRPEAGETGPREALAAGDRCTTGGGGAPRGGDGPARGGGEPHAGGGGRDAPGEGKNAAGGRRHAPGGGTDVPGGRRDALGQSEDGGGDSEEGCGDSEEGRGESEEGRGESENGGSRDRFAGSCTICGGRWFSHRATGTGSRQALLAVLTAEAPATGKA